MRRFIDIVCENPDCQHELVDQYLDWNDKLPVCEECKTGQMVRLYNASSLGAVIGDDLPGGVMIRHGICNPDGTPKRYDSKTEIRRAAKKAGLEWGHDLNRHVPTPGSDKNKFGHTAKW